MAQAPDGPPPQPGFWQPGGVFPQPTEDKTATSRFILLDTGGSGGMFGKGALIIVAAAAERSAQRTLRQTPPS